VKGTAVTLRSCKRAENLSPETTFDTKKVIASTAKINLEFLSQHRKNWVKRTEQGGRLKAKSCDSL